MILSMLPEKARSMCGREKSRKEVQSQLLVTSVLKGLIVTITVVVHQVVSVCVMMM